MDQLDQPLLKACDFGPVPVVMSLDPPWYKLMWTGQKTYEFRRRFLTGSPAQWFVYLTAPENHGANLVTMDTDDQELARALTQKAVERNRTVIDQDLAAWPRGWHTAWLAEALAERADQRALAQRQPRSLPRPSGRRHDHRTLVGAAAGGDPRRGVCADRPQTGVGPALPGPVLPFPPVHTVARDVVPSQRGGPGGVSRS